LTLIGIIYNIPVPITGIRCNGGEDMAQNDTVLAGKIKKGNKQSFRKLYNRYHKRLYYLAKQYLKDEDLAKDAVQDVFLKLWDKREGLDLSASIEGFLFTMLKNHLLNMIRDEKNRKKIIEEVKRTAQNREVRNSTEEEIIYNEYRNLIDEAVVRLSPAKRNVFEMRSFEGLSNAEVADKKGVSEHTVKTQYYLSSKFIRDYMKKYADLLLLVLVWFII
jgi:RNA polymerase sigma-70 factor (ECF subfamily)